MGLTLTDRSGSAYDRSAGDDKRVLRGSLPRWYLVAMAVILLCALFLNFWRLGAQGYDNLYYAAAIKSMLMNWHNFFFVSFDPAGFVSVDKPPVAFWLQVASARVFGLNPWSVVLPQALAGVLSVPLLAYLVRRTYGPLAGLLAAAALVVTPINVVTDRNMTMDCLLVFIQLLAAWAVLRSVESGRLRYLLLCALLIGIGFNVKMMDAYVILPACGLLYWFAAPQAKRIRLLHLALALLVVLLVSFSWAVCVDLTPAAQRPYVGSSGGNSALQLAFLYNGGARLVGNWKELSLFPMWELMQINQRLPAFARPEFWLGTPGLFRLAIHPLGEQIGWLLPLVLPGFIGVQWDKPSLWPLNRQQQGLALWGVWFLTQFILFSSASFTHQYYVVQMAPALCAMLAIGIVTMWRTVTGWMRLVLPLALLLTTLLQLNLLYGFLQSWEGWLLLPVLLALLISILLLRPEQRWRGGLVAVSFCALLIAPTVWAALPVLTGRDDAFPYAGPAVSESSLEQEVLQSDQAMVPDQELMTYLLQRQGKARYVFATATANEAAPTILASGRAVMALGGYTGGDQILTTTQLRQLVQRGDVRYFVFAQSIQEAAISPALKEYQQNYSALLASTGIGTIDPLIQWVRTSCAPVPQRLWHTSSKQTLLDVFDCG